MFVVGAGASSELNFPVGTTLKTRIKQVLRSLYGNKFSTSSSYDIQQAFDEIAHQQCNIESGKLTTACRQICQNIDMANSIDVFLDSHSDNEHIAIAAKIAIFQIIAEAERQSPLFVEKGKTFDSSLISETWYTKLWAILHQGIRQDNVEDIFSNCSFIVFNYDRCIEQFFYLAVTNFYGLSPSHSEQILSRLNVIHVYGSLGDLNEYEYGSYAPEDLVTSTSRIKTFFEQAQSDLLTRIAQAEERADRIVFLGCGYNPMNMKLLKSAVPDRVKVKKVDGTCLHMSSEAVNAVTRSLESIYRGGNPGSNLLDASCASFLDRLYLQYLA